MSHKLLESEDAPVDVLGWASSHPSPSDKMISPTSRALNRMGGHRSHAALHSLGQQRTLFPHDHVNPQPGGPAGKSSLVSHTHTNIARIPSKLATAPVQTWMSLESAGADPTPTMSSISSAFSGMGLGGGGSAEAPLPPLSPEPRSQLHRVAVRQAYLSGQKGAGGEGGVGSSSSSIKAQGGGGVAPMGSLEADERREGLAKQLLESMGGGKTEGGWGGLFGGNSSSANNSAIKGGGSGSGSSSSSSSSKVPSSATKQQRDLGGMQQEDEEAMGGIIGGDIKGSGGFGGGVLFSQGVGGGDEAGAGLLKSPSKGLSFFR